ncbi:MAG: DUF2283 domain-containing protein [Nitrospirae bacterium]|nr:DUF2283 domain-containing protein [Nitrospirota bacterium]
MKIKYDSDADVLILVLRDMPPIDAIEEPGGVIVSYGEDGEPVSVEFINASTRQLIRPDEVSVTLQTKST